MRFSVRLDSLDSHARITVFANGANAGQLFLRPEEYVALCDRLGCPVRMDGPDMHPTTIPHPNPTTRSSHDHQR